MHIGRRIMTSMNAARRAFTQAWSEKSLSTLPLIGVNSLTEWNTFSARLFRYTDAFHYFGNTTYTNVQKYFTGKRVDQKLYRFMLPIYNPVQRSVEAYVAKVFGGMLDTETLTTGAIPIVTSNPAVIDALRQLWAWSDWGRQKAVMTRLCAICGDVGLKVVDDRQRGKVRMEVLHPGLFEDVQFDGVGNVKRVVISFNKVDERGTEFLYTEIIDKEQFATFRDGKPFAFFMDASGNPVETWANEYGFVPVVIGKFRDIGEHWGANVLYGTWRKVDILNDIASLLNREIRKNVVQVYAVTGASKKDDLVLTGTEENIPFLELPKDATINPLAHSLDINATRSVIEDHLKELERDMPELSLHRIRESGGNLTAPGVRSAYSDAISRVQEVRGNLDATLVRAQMMAMSVGALGGYENFNFAPNAFVDGDLEHHIKGRAVIEDELTQLERVQALIQMQAPAEVVLKEMGGFSAEEIETVGASITQLQQQQALLGAQSSIVNQQSSNADALALLGRGARTRNGGNGNS